MEMGPDSVPGLVERFGLRFPGDPFPKRQDPPERVESG
jgi:hypothetical protein